MEDQTFHLGAGVSRISTCDLMNHKVVSEYKFLQSNCLSKSIKLESQFLRRQLRIKSLSL